MSFKSRDWNILAVVGFLFLFLLVSCVNEVANDNSENEERYVKLTFSSEEAMQIEQPELILRIYGYDPVLQDTLASLVAKEKFEATEIPFTVRIQIPEDPAALVEGLREGEDALYYVNLEWDSDGNGEICEGDIGIDYDAKIPNLDMETEEEQMIYLTHIPESTLCE